MQNKVSTNRWLEAQEREKKGIENPEDIREWLRVRRITWANLYKLLRDEVSFQDLNHVLEIGGGPTSIFLALKEGERYAVDPMYERLFDLHPFMRDVEEYQNVKFIGRSIEKADLAVKFDLIVSINMLDHIGDLPPVIQKMDELLLPSGMLIIVVDCYADKTVRNIIKFFDADVPHIHHFINKDIINLFLNYKLIKQDDRIYKLLDVPAFQGQKNEIPVYRFDKLFSRMKHDLKIWDKDRDTIFIVKFFLCYGLALTTATLRRREIPTHPLKKGRLFIFQKQ